MRGTMPRMAIISINAFRGTDRLSSPTLRAHGVAEESQLASFRGGSLVPLGTRSVQAATRVRGQINAGSRFLSRWWNGDAYQWVSWADLGGRPVDFVEGVVPNDIHHRGYWTGSGNAGRPRMGVRSTALDTALGQAGTAAPLQNYLLGVPRMTQPPRLTDGLVLPEDEDGDLNDVAWIHTLVSGFGEEGPPSSPSVEITINDGQPVNLTLPAVTPAMIRDRAFSLGPDVVGTRRLYRANTGTEATAYQFVREVPVDLNEMLDDVPGHRLGEAVPSLSSDSGVVITWHEPPGRLEGLVALPNGVLAGFVDDTVWLSEPFLPHAWPDAYTHALDHPIVRLEVLSQGLVVLTQGRPYVVAGVHPSNMAAARMDFSQGCLNPRSVVNMGDEVWYCAPDGLASVSAKGPTLVTQGILSPKDWRDLYDVERLLSFHWEGRYVALLDADVDPATTADGRPKLGFVVDPQHGLCDIDWKCTGGFSDPEDGSLRLLGLER